jgi:hypothetical protein
MGSIPYRIDAAPPVSCLRRWEVAGGAAERDGGAIAANRAGREEGLEKEGGSLNERERRASKGGAP